MQKETYFLKIKELESEFCEKKEQLYKEYVISNGKFKIGDIVKFEKIILKIDCIVGYGFPCKLPKPMYYGFQLKKDLTLSKKPKRARFYGDNAELILHAK